MRRATLGMLLVLVAVPSMASAQFTPTIPSLAAVEAGCFPKGTLAIPLPGSGANPPGATQYKISAVNGADETTPCAALPSGAPVAYGTFLQWAATPGATSYRIFRNDVLLATVTPTTVGALGVTCPATNVAARCQFLDTGSATTSGAPKPLPVAVSQAGSHPDFNITQAFDYGGANSASNTDDPAPDGTATSASLKDNILHFPAGLLASAVAANDTCSITELIGAPATNTGGAGTTDTGEDKCSRASQVGEVLANIQSNAPGNPPSPSNPPTPTVGDIYLGEKLTAGDAVTARLFVALRPPCSQGYPAPLNPGGSACNSRLGGAGREVEKSFLSAKATIRQDGSFGIDNETTSVSSGVDEDLAPNSNIRSTTTGALLAPVPIQVRSLTQRLFGFADQGTSAAADDKPFVSLPTSCATKTFSVDAASYLNPALVNASTALPTITGCANVPFSPVLSASVDTSNGQSGQNAHPGFVATITQASNEAATKTATVVLPEGLGTNIAALANVCTTAQQATGCPTSSQVGVAEATTPVLPGKLAGPVFIAENNSPSNTSGLPKLIVALQSADGATKIRFDGAIGFDASATRLVNTFDNLPEVTLSTFKLAIAGGPNGLLSNTRDLCAGGLGNVDAAFVGHNGATVTRSPAVAGADYYCVPNPPPNPGCSAKKPKQSLKVAGVKKGRPSVKVKIRRGDNCPKSNLRKTTFKLARGLRFVKGAKKGIGVRADGKKVKFAAKGKLLTVKTNAKTRTIIIAARSGTIAESRKVQRRGTKQKLKFVTKVRVRSGKTYTIKKSVKPKS